MKPSEPKKLKILVHLKTLKPSNKQWEINLIIMKDKLRHQMWLSEKEVYQLSLLQVIPSEDKLLNGKYLIPIWPNLQKKIKKKNLPNKKSIRILPFINHPLRDVWKLWKELLFKMIKKINTMITNIIGLREKY